MQEAFVLPTCQGQFGEDYYCYQQDEAPSHAAIIVQNWCAENLADFLKKKEWPSSSSDLNPLDFFFAWSYMLAKLKEQKLGCLKRFKQVIFKICKDMPIMCDVRALSRLTVCL